MVHFGHRGKSQRDDAQVRRLTYWTFKLAQEVRKMAGEIERLTAQVERNTEVDQSAVVLLKGLATEIARLKTDPAALQALADKITASSDALAEAVVANTPAEEPPVEPPVV